jgi:hypothetical protein
MGESSGGLRRIHHEERRSEVMTGSVRKLRWFIDSMLGYWVLLLTISLGSAAVIYEIWLKGRM